MIYDIHFICDIVFLTGKGSDSHLMAIEFDCSGQKSDHLPRHMLCASLLSHFNSPAPIYNHFYPVRYIVINPGYVTPPKIV